MSPEQEEKQIELLQKIHDDLSTIVFYITICPVMVLIAYTILAWFT
jgi:hypothetical protein